MISKPVKHQILTLGEQISKFTFPEEFTDVINRAYDNDKKSLPGWNQELVGKIQSEHNVNQIINDQLKKIFMACFQQYITSLEKGEILLKSQTLKLGDAWINEMYSGEYNPAHYHQGKKSLVGLSSVINFSILSNSHKPSNIFSGLLYVKENLALLVFKLDGFISKNNQSFLLIELPFFILVCIDNFFSQREINSFKVVISSLSSNHKYNIEAT